MSSATMSPTSLRPFRFGVQVNATEGRAQWVDLARRIEGAGYSTMTMPDHFGGQLAPVPALQCAVDATTTLRVGALVHDNDYKHPVVLAKELATMDVLSDGRVEIGLGAGWAIEDYEWSGIAYDPPGVRISRMIEGLAVIRGCHGADRFSFHGEHYTVTDYAGMPKPVQDSMPVLIGGGGPRVLRFAARHADIVGINATLTSGAVDRATFQSMTPRAVDEKVSIVSEAATEAARRAEIELSVRSFMVTVTDDVDATVEMVSGFTGATAAEVTGSPFVLIGPPSKLADDLRDRRARWGFSYVIIGQQEFEAFAPIVAELADT